MIQNVPLISTIAIAFGLAFILGLLVAKIKISPIVGYLLAGILIGPSTPGFVAHIALAKELSEIGVMLLMFGVGLHFSIDDLMSVRRIAIPGAVLQILVATTLGVGVALLWGFALPSAIIFGLALSVASTVVLLRALEERGILETTDARIAVGWLVVEDIAMLLILVLIPSFSSWHVDNVKDHHAILSILGITIFKISIFIGFMLIIGRKIFPKLLWIVAKIGSRELFILCVVSTAISLAYLASTLFDVSFALGAFFAGMIMRESELSHRAAEESLPLRDAFAVLFFVSVGMLFNPAILINEPLRVLAVVGIIVIGKSIAAVGLVTALRYPMNTALTVAVSLAQIGEFSFILAGAGVSSGLLSIEAQNLILAGALISIAINPFLFTLLNPFILFIKKQLSHQKQYDKTNKKDSFLEIKEGIRDFSKHVLLVGDNSDSEFQLINFLKKNGIAYVNLSQPDDLMDSFKKSNLIQKSEDPSEPVVLIHAGISKAKILLIFVTDSFNAHLIIKNAKLLNPKIKIILCLKNNQKINLFANEKSVKIFTAEQELINKVSEYLTEKYIKT